MLSCRDKRGVNCNAVSDSGVVVSGGDGGVVVWLLVLLLLLLLLLVVLIIVCCTCLGSTCTHKTTISMISSCQIATMSKGGKMGGAGIKGTVKMKG